MTGKGITGKLTGKSGRTVAATPRRSADRIRTLRLVVALCAIVGAAGCIAASTLTWLSLPDDTGGLVTLSGWGSVSGGQISGQNVNDVTQGFASYRPGALAVVIGALALVAGFGIALVSRGEKPHRIPASVLTLVGLGGLAWGLIRGISPGDLSGVYADAHSQISSGLGPWLTAGSSLVLVAVAVVVFAGLLDPPPPLVLRRGIQPR